MIVIMFAKLEQARHRHRSTAFPKGGDQRSRAAVADHQVGVPKQPLHLLEGQGFDDFQALRRGAANADLRDHTLPG
jgi:hypothetical protein